MVVERREIRNNVYITLRKWGGWGGGIWGVKGGWGGSKRNIYHRE